MKVRLIALWRQFREQDSALARWSLLWSTAALVFAAAPSHSALAVQQSEVLEGMASAFTVYGDIDVDFGPGTSAGGALELILKDKFGRTVRSVSVVGVHREYRFSDLPMGEYTMVLRDGFHELGRLRLEVNETGRSEIRKDLMVVRREPEQVSPPSLARLVYARPAANQGRWKEAARLSEEGDSEGVVKLLEQITKEDPADFEALTQLGVARSKLKRWKQAEDATLRAIEARSDFFPAWLNLGKLRFSIENFSGAVEALEQAVRLRPSSAISHYLLGECYLSMQLGSKAVPHLEEAIRLDPRGMAVAHVRLGQLYDGAGLKERAVKEFKEYLAKKPGAKNRKAIKDYIEKHETP